MKHHIKIFAVLFIFFLLFSVLPSMVQASRQLLTPEVSTDTSEKIIPQAVSGSSTIYLPLVVKSTAPEQGLASLYPEDNGITNSSSVIFASGFEATDWHKRDFGYSGWLSDRGYYVKNSNLAFSGSGVLEYQNLQGTHNPHVMNIDFPGKDIVYLRWYRRYESGYDFSCQGKTNGVYATDPNVPSNSGEKPTGYDKFSTKLQVWNSSNKGEAKFYTYYPDQTGLYGDTLRQNVGSPIVFKPNQWYSIEIMLKANDAGKKNGEIKLWIDGTLKGQYTGMHFRDTNKLKINELNITAYIGGDCTASKNQKVWDDNLVLATQYIGPMKK
jgi:hypothetical protein